MVLFLAMVACSEVGHKGIYSEMAQNIAAKIPSGSKVAIKITSPEKNGLPENFLQKLVAEFAEALIKAGNSKFVVLNRNSTEEIWKEAIEFNNQDSEKITSSAEADISITLSPKISQNGIDLSITAYSLKDGSTGNMLASASELIPMNIKAELGVDVKDLNQQVDKLTKLVDKENAVKVNELDKLFRNFAHKGAGWIDLAKTYQEGCQKPERFEDKLDGQGLRLKCEIYNNGDLVRGENELLERTTDISLLNADSGRSFVGAVRIDLHRADGASLGIPPSLNKFITLLYCDPSGAASFGERIYKISIPDEKNSTAQFYNGNEKFFVNVSWSGGSGGTSSTVYMFKNEAKLPIAGREYIKSGERFLNSADQNRRCQ